MVLLTTVEASQVLGLSISSTRDVLVKADVTQKSKRCKSINYYDKDRVWEVRAAREAGTFKRPARKYKRTVKVYVKKRIACSKCGAGTTKKGGICKSCSSAVNLDDPYGTMIKRKKQKRRCPTKGCGAELWEGQYQCGKCKQKNASVFENGIDPELAYGGLAI